MRKSEKKSPNFLGRSGPILRYSESSHQIRQLGWNRIFGSFFDLMSSGPMCPTHEWEWVGLWVRCREAPEWMFWRHSPHASDDHQVIYSLVIVQRWADCTTSRTSSIWSGRRLWSRILGTKTLNHRGVGTNTIWNVFPTEFIQKGLLSDPALVTRFPGLVQT